MDSLSGYFLLLLLNKSLIIHVYTYFFSIKDPELINISDGYIRMYSKLTKFTAMEEYSIAQMSR